MKKLKLLVTLLVLFIFVSSPAWAGIGGTPSLVRTQALAINKNYASGTAIDALGSVQFHQRGDDAWTGAPTYGVQLGTMAFSTASYYMTARSTGGAVVAGIYGDGSILANGFKQIGKAVVNNNAAATYTVPGNDSYIAFTGTNVATLAFTFPAAAAGIDGLEIAIYTQAAVGTSVTWGSTGATFVGAPATLAAGSVTRWIYHHATAQWLPR